MKLHAIPTALVALALAATAANAACYADYKAKQDSPLRLHYGVIQISDGACGSIDAAEAEVRGRLAGAGWELLNVMSVFDDAGLDQRKESAAEFFLRF
ncbi:MAG: hypothetical protein AAF771_08590 [Pseudomonadota bacterium]